MKPDNHNNYHFHRFEFKYHLSPFKAEQVRKELLDYYFVVDPQAENLPGQKYIVNSLYLDSPSYMCYHDKIHGLKNRFKVRVRSYSAETRPEDEVFVEIRRKQDALIVKDRFKSRLGDWQEHYQKGLKSGLAENRRTAEDINYHIKRFNLRPKVLVQYARVPLEAKFIKRLRVTFDSNLKAAFTGDMQEDTLYSFSKDLVVMEIKYLGSLPLWLGRIIQKYNLDRRPNSKYCNAALELSKLNLLK